MESKNQEVAAAMTITLSRYSFMTCSLKTVSDVTLFISGYTVILKKEPIV
jgi:hypothetical protein